LNIGDLFLHGYSVSKIDPQVADHLLAEINRQSYVVSQDYRDPEITAPMITAWDAETDREVVAVHNAPPALQKFWVEFGSCPSMRWFHENFGPFTQGSVIINKYRHGDGMGWHYDVPDSTMLQCLIYVGDVDFAENDGGCLEIGRCNVNNHGIPQKDSIIPLSTIPPTHGTVVTILNTNPTLLHRVTPLKAPKNRFTLVCRYGYLENTFTLKKWRVMKGLDQG